MLFSNKTGYKCSPIAKANRELFWLSVIQGKGRLLLGKLRRPAADSEGPGRGTESGLGSRPGRDNHDLNTIWRGASWQHCGPERCWWHSAGQQREAGLCLNPRLPWPPSSATRGRGRPRAFPGEVRPLLVWLVRQRRLPGWGSERSLGIQLCSRRQGCHTLPKCSGPPAPGLIPRPHFQKSWASRCSLSLSCSPAPPLRRSVLPRPESEGASSWAARALRRSFSRTGSRGKAEALSCLLTSMSGGLVLGEPRCVARWRCVLLKSWVSMTGRHCFLRNLHSERE